MAKPKGDATLTVQCRTPDGRWKDARFVGTFDPTIAGLRLDNGMRVVRRPKP